MRVLVALEHRFLRTPDGAVHTQTAFARRFWERYLSVFDEVTVVARVGEVASVPAGWHRADGDRVRFAAVPHFVGPRAFLLQRGAVRRVIADAVRDAANDAVILRVPGTIGGLVRERLGARPYGAEVVGDPWDVFSPGSVRHPARAFFRWWFTRRLERECRDAVAACYVTAEALQRRYPTRGESFACSDVEIGSGPGAHGVTLASEPRRFTGPAKRLLCVGTMAEGYKGQDVLLEALARCSWEGVRHFELMLAGDGRLRQEFERQAKGLDLTDRVRFLGQLPAGEAIARTLDEADVFVLPSRQEGLPRALVEAMARGLPCIATAVGGTPELLAREDLVPPGDADALAKKIREVALSPQRLNAASERNLAAAASYVDESIRERRDAFFDVVRRRTEAWLAAAPRAVAA